MLEALFRVMRSKYKPEIAAITDSIQVFDRELAERRKEATAH
jgi:hypothetical protein